MTGPVESSRSPQRQAMALRGDFVRAFVEHAGPRPASERMVVRWPTLITVTALTAAAAVVVGIFLKLWSSESAGSAAGPGGAAPPPPAAATQLSAYTAIAGWDCEGAADRGFEAHGRTPDWRTVAVGGWPQDGCHGTFETLPMTGQAGTDDPAQYGEWWFAPTSPVSRCQISVYVPSGGAPEDTAATAAHYVVLDGRGGGPSAEFAVDQHVGRGRWVVAGEYKVSSAGLAVKLTNRGVPAHAGDRIAMAQIKVDCSR
ncbi:hypothetical protein [Dactylosporangium sp. CA-233914]|uniref:hypothetical protein n=1 Tax=Dactylosporangium sp. CA-233914 TaxID=3239934 RepID=UPI003D8B950A